MVENLPAPSFLEAEKEGTRLQDLETIGRLLERVKELNGRIEKSQSKLKEMTATRDKILELDIPDLLASKGISKVTVSSGEEISIQKQYYASISAKNSKAALAWLDEHGHGAIVKPSLKLTLKKGERTVADKIAQLVEKETGRTVVVMEGVHAGTLKAFVKEQLENEVKLPMDLLGVFVKNVTKVTKGS